MVAPVTTLVNAVFNAPKGAFLWLILFRIIDGSEATNGVGQLRRQRAGKFEKTSISVTYIYPASATYIEKF